MFSIDLTKLPFLRALLIIFALYSGLITPAWYIFQFANDLFQKTELVKLIIISLAIGIPVIILNLFVELTLRAYYLPDEKNEDEDEDEETEMIKSFNGSMISCIFIFYTPIVGSFFKSTSLKEAIVTSMIVQAILIYGDIRRARHDAWVKKQKKQDQRAG